MGQQYELLVDWENSWERIKQTVLQNIPYLKAIKFCRPQ